MKKIVNKIKRTILFAKKHTIAFVYCILIVIASSISLAFVITDQSHHGMESNIKTEDTKTLVFKSGDDVSLKSSTSYLNTYNDNLIRTTKPSVTLSSNEYEEDFYNVYLEINNNTLDYLSFENEPTIMLQIFDHNNNEVKEIKNIDYTTFNGMSGFDLTDLNSGIYEVSLNEKIETVDETKHEWTFKFTYVNYDINHQINGNKKLSATIILDDEFHDVGVSIVDNVMNNLAVNLTDFNELTENSSGLFKENDVYGDTYYFRGDVDNNWILFNDMYFRIIRINGDNSIRLLYAGSKKNNSLDIGYGRYNEIITSIEYSNYMYNNGLEEELKDSTIKEIIDKWYENNMSSMTKYISDTVFCYDSTSYVYENGIYTQNNIHYGKLSTTIHFNSLKNYYENAPRLTCDNENDNYSVADLVNGNGMLTYPVGLITLDELYLAGNIIGNDNSNIYTYSGKMDSIGSPVMFSDANEVKFIDFSSTTNAFVRGYNDLAVRPVISIKGTLISDGSGTYNDPYVINR